jgi:hypothetical protein
MKNVVSVSSLACLAVIAAACGGSSGSSGGSGEPTVVAPADRTVVISELNYHDVSDDDANDFVELLNLSEEDVDLSGWCIRGVGYCFEMGASIAAGEYLVVYGADFDGRLGNKGEEITLEDPAGNVQDSVAYADSDPWPTSADGEGDSLHRVNAPDDGTSAEAWEAGTPTPGAARPGAGA